MYDEEQLKQYIEKALLTEDIMIKQYYLERAYELIGGILSELVKENGL